MTFWTQQKGILILSGGNGHVMQLSYIFSVNISDVVYPQKVNQNSYTVFQRNQNSYTVYQRNTDDSKNTYECYCMGNNKFSKLP